VVTGAAKPLWLWRFFFFCEKRHGVRHSARGKIAKRKSGAGQPRGSPPLLTGAHFAIALIGAPSRGPAPFVPPGPAHLPRVPLALAIFLSFLLAPTVKALQRWGLGRIPAASFVIILAASLVAGLGWIIVRQASGVVSELPNYSANIKSKVKTLRDIGGSSTQ